jgi:hypothetical protein
MVLGKCLAQFAKRPIPYTDTEELYLFPTRDRNRRYWILDIKSKTGGHN